MGHPARRCRLVDYASRASRCGYIEGHGGVLGLLRGYEMTPKLLNVGFGNMVVSSRVVAIVTPSSAPMKRLKEGAKDAGKLIDATQGRRTRSIVITDSDHIVLSAVQAETVTQRFVSDDKLPTKG